MNKADAAHLELTDFPSGKASMIPVRYGEQPPMPSGESYSPLFTTSQFPKQVFVHIRAL